MCMTSAWRVTAPCSTRNIVTPGCTVNRCCAGGNAATAARGTTRGCAAIGSQSKVSGVREAARDPPEPSFASRVIEGPARALFAAAHVHFESGSAGARRMGWCGCLKRRDVAPRRSAFMSPRPTPASGSGAGARSCFGRVLRALWRQPPRRGPRVVHVHKRAIPRRMLTFAPEQWALVRLRQLAPRDPRTVAH